MTISLSYRLITFYGFTEGIINENENKHYALLCDKGVQIQLIQDMS
jgi:hypothetical protein